jgi:hypothetical protein
MCRWVLYCGQPTNVSNVIFGARHSLAAQAECAGYTPGCPDNPSRNHSGAPSATRNSGTGKTQVLPTQLTCMAVASAGTPASRAAAWLTKQAYLVRRLSSSLHTSLTPTGRLRASCCVYDHVRAVA